MNGFDNNGNNGFNQQNGNGFGGNQNGFNNQQNGNFGGQQNGNFQQGGNFQNNGGNFQQGGNFQGGNAAPGEMFIDMNEQASTGFGLLPAGRYNVEISAAEFTATSSQTGYVLKLQHTVLDGEFAGRTLFENFNIQNSNQQAQQIGQRDYAALCKALYGDGYREKNPNALIGKRFVADVDQHKQKKKNQNPDVWGDQSEQEQKEPETRNRITARSPYRGNQQQGQQQNNGPMSQPQNHQQGGNQQFNQQGNNGNFQQPNNQQGGNFQQPQNNGGQNFQQPNNGGQQGNNQFQQNGNNGFTNTGSHVQEQNQPGQNAGGNGTLQPDQQTNQFTGNVNQQGNNGFGGNGGFPNGGGSQFPQM